MEFTLAEAESIDIAKRAVAEQLTVTSFYGPCRMLTSSIVHSSELQTCNMMYIHILYIMS